MRKSRLISLTAVPLLVAACTWVWWDRDRLALKLVNPLLEGSRVEELDGLQLGLERLSIERLKLSLNSGAQLQLHDLQLQDPWSLVFTSGKNRCRLTIANLAYTPAETEAGDPPPEKVAETTSPQDLSLGDSIKFLQRHLPEKLLVGELSLQGADAQGGRLDLNRDFEKQAVRAVFSSRGQQLSVHLQLRDRQLEVTAQLDTDRQSRALSLTGELAQDDAGQWRGTAQLQSDLQQINGLPLPENLHEIAAGATGKLSVNIRAQLPDQILQLGKYGEVSLALQSESVRIPLPQGLLGAAMDATVSTTDPIAVRLGSLQPLRPEDFSGSGTFDLALRGALAPEGQPSLLWGRFDTSTAQARPALNIDGTLNLQAVNPLLVSPHWRKKFAPLTLDSADGVVRFRGSAKLKPLTSIGDDGQGWLNNIDLALLPESRASLTVATSDGEDSGLAQLGWQRGSVEIRLPKALTLQADQWPGELRIAGNVNLKAQEERKKISITSQLQEIDCRIADKTSCSLALSAESPELLQEINMLSVGKPSISAQLELALEGDQLQGQLRQAELRAESITRDSIEVERLSLLSPQLDCTFARGETICESAELTAGFSTLKAPELQSSGSLIFKKLQFKRTNDQLSLSAGYRSDNLKLQALSRYKLHATVDGELALNGDALAGTSQFLVGATQLQAQWRHDLDSVKGGASFTLTPVEFSRAQSLGQSVQGLPVDIVAGTISARGRYSWPSAQQDSIRMQLEEVAAVYGDSFAAGLSGEISLQRQGELWITNEPQAIQLDTLDAGLPIENIHFSLALDEQQDLILNTVSAELLGGTLESPQLVWNLAGEERRSQIQIDGISLRELTREMEAENFAATGILDLQIPLITSAEGVTVKQGQVKARPPGGRLRYYGAFSAQMLSSNPQLKLLAGALEDYNYRELSGTLEYPPSGDMQLQLKLVGRSESVAADRDLIINLSLENNIPDMLRSLQASRDLTEALEKQIQ